MKNEDNAMVVVSQRTAEELIAQNSDIKENILISPVFSDDVAFLISKDRFLKLLDEGEFAERKPRKDIDEIWEMQ